MSLGWIIGLMLIGILVGAFILFVCIDERTYSRHHRHIRREAKAYAERKVWNDQINYWYDARRNGSPMEKLIADDMVEYLKDMRDNR